MRWCYSADEQMLYEEEGKSLQLELLLLLKNGDTLLLLLLLPDDCLTVNELLLLLVAAASCFCSTADEVVLDEDGDEATS